MTEGLTLGPGENVIHELDMALAAAAVFAYSVKEIVESQPEIFTTTGNVRAGKLRMAWDNGDLQKLTFSDYKTLDIGNTRGIKIVAELNDDTEKVQIIAFVSTGIWQLKFQMQPILNELETT